MRFDEALGINIWTTAAMACGLQACVWLCSSYFSCVLNELLFGILLFFCGCTAGLCHSLSSNGVYVNLGCVGNK